MKFSSVIILAAAAVAAENSPSSQRIDRAVQAIEHRSWDKAAGLLEEAKAEQNPENLAKVNELLGIAYLGSADKLSGEIFHQKAEEAMNRALELNGRAAIYVDRAFDRRVLGLRTPNPQDIKRGLLYITREAVIFEPSAVEQGARGEKLTIPGPNFRELALNKGSGAGTGFFRFETTSGEYHFRTANHDTKEADMLFRIMHKHMSLSGLKGKK